MTTRNLAAWGRNPATGLLQSDYAPINAAYQMPDGYFSPSRFNLSLIHPRPDSETSQYSFHRIAQTGQPWSIPIRAMWGSYPHAAEIISAPTGVTIGEWLDVDGFGDLAVNESYLNLSWPNPTAGTHSISVRINDQTGANVVARFTLTVGENYYYVGTSAAGSGDGSSYANRATLASAQILGSQVANASPALNKILCFTNGEYTIAEDLSFTSIKPRGVCVYNGHTATVVAGSPTYQIRIKTHDFFWSGVKVKSFGNAAGFRIATGEVYDRCSVWRTEFIDFVGVDGASNNEAGWFCDSTGSSVKRQNFLFSEITFTNCHEVCAYDWYGVHGLVDRHVWNTNLSTIKEPIWFPKASCEYEIRHCKFDNTTVTFPDNDAVIYPYNSEIDSRVKGVVRFNFVRIGATGQTVSWNGAENGAGNNYAADGHDDRNSYVGGKMIARLWGGGDHIDFLSEVIQNAAGGVAETTGAYTIVNTECVGVSGIVDSNGRLTGTYNTNYRGKRGSQIFKP